MRILTIALFALAACRAAPQPLDAALAALCATPALAGGRVGVCVRDVSDGRVLVATDDERGFAPASNLKLVTAAVALHTLGPTYAFRTVVDVRGVVRDGVLHGDLVLRGGGDPTLGSECGGDALAARTAMALAALGVRRITGRVVAAADWLGDEHLGHGWQWDYLDEDYAAPFGGLCWNGNVQRIRVAVVDGKPCAAAVGPWFGGLRCEATCGAAGSGVRVTAQRRLGSDDVLVRGSMASDARPATLAVTVADPTSFAAFGFAAALRRAGVAIDGDEAAMADDVVVTVEHASRPLGDVVVPLLRDSDNLYAEQCLRVAAREASGRGDGVSAARHAETVLRSLGVEPNGAVIADGSGLSRRDLLQPRQVAALLLAMHRSPYRQPFVDALPVAGVSGTLRSRFRDSAAAGRVRAKTGTLSRVSCLSGYVERDDGAPLVFSVMLNDYLCTDAQARQAIDAFVTALVDASSAIRTST